MLSCHKNLVPYQNHTNSITSTKEDQMLIYLYVIYEHRYGTLNIEN